MRRTLFIGLALILMLVFILPVSGAEVKGVPMGSIMTYGTYPQTEEGTDQTPIEWIVLDYDEANKKALLLSRYGLDAAPYNKDYNAITWERCTLRTWLNSEFLKKAFSAEEQSAILVTDVDNSSVQGFSEYDADGGNNTQDHIFLLSYAEANRCLGVTHDDYENIMSRVTPTAYATAHGALTSVSDQTADGMPAGWWWLRSPGRSQDLAAAVLSDGSLIQDGVGHDDYVVRPAFWLNLDE